MGGSGRNRASHQGLSGHIGMFVTLRGPASLPSLLGDSLCAHSGGQSCHATMPALRSVWTILAGACEFEIRAA